MRPLSSDCGETARDGLLSLQGPVPSVGAGPSKGTWRENELMCSGQGCSGRVANGVAANSGDG